MSESKPLEWHINCVGDIADGSDTFVVSGPWKETDPLYPIPVIERSAYDAVVAERDEWREQQMYSLKVRDSLQDEVDALNHELASKDQALELLREAAEALDRTTHHLENLQVSHPHDCDLDGTLTKIRESGLLGEK